MEISNLTGLSKPLTKLIEVISNGIGAISKPYLIRKTADAKAYEIKRISDSIKRNQTNLGNICYDSEKVNLVSLDSPSSEKSKSLEERAENRFHYKELKKQSNIENITQIAAHNLNSEDTVSDEPVDEDWTTRFFNYAEGISNEEMQNLWGRILAGEVIKPKSYSLRTLDFLKSITKEEAEIFTRFAEIRIEHSNDAFIFYNDKGALIKSEFKISFDDCLLMKELGLIKTEVDLAFTFQKVDKETHNAVFTCGEKCVVAQRKESTPDQSVIGLFFTKIGLELSQLIPQKPTTNYLEGICFCFKNPNVEISYGNYIKLPNGMIELSNEIKLD